MIAVWAGMICQVTAMVFIIREKEGKTRLEKNLYVTDPDGNAYMLEEDREETDCIFYKTADLYQIIRILAHASESRRDGKIKIDRRMINQIQASGITMIHPDTGEKMNADKVYDALRTMAMDNKSNLIK